MKRLPILLLTAALFSTSACAQPTSGNLDRKAIEQIVADYILENPKIIEQALIELDRRNDADMLNAVRAQLENDDRDATIGPKDAKVTIVEFFDYNCSFCKQSTAWVRETIDKYPDDVRVVFKELPILERRSKTSRNASIAALAAARQGKYPAMHFAMMDASNLAHERVEALAKTAGLDIEMWKQDMQDEGFQAQIEDTIRLAQQMPALNGTPFFVIDDEYVAGADMDKLKRIFEKALNK
ncbi:MAG: thioredoxin domain-containing protein [Robiginitomaculum sp.]